MQNQKRIFDLNLAIVSLEKDIYELLGCKSHELKNFGGHDRVKD